MVKTVILAAGVAGWATSVAFVAATSTRRLSDTDRAFVTAVSLTNNFQMKAALLAQRVAPGDSAQAAARTAFAIRSEFAAALQRTVTLREPRFVLPTGVDRAHRLMLATLRAAGPTFSDEYNKQVLASQGELQALYQGYSGQPHPDAAIRTMVRTAMPTPASPSGAPGAMKSLAER